MIEAVKSLLTNTPPVAPPKDLEMFKCGQADGLEAGVAVKIESGDKNEATVEEASVDGSDMIGITTSEAEDDDDYVRIQYVMPGIVLRGVADSAKDIGDTVGLNSDRDGFDDGTEGCFKVIKVEQDEDDDWKIVYVVPINGELDIV